MSIEDTMLYHSCDLKQVYIKSRVQCILNPFSILTFPSHFLNPILPFILSYKHYDFRSNFICLVSTIFHLPCRTTVPKNSLVLIHFILLNTSRQVDSLDPTQASKNLNSSRILSGQTF